MRKKGVTKTMQESWGRDGEGAGGGEVQEKWKQRARVKTEEGNKRREERQPRRKASLDL